MGDTRRRNGNWTVCGEADKNVSFDGAQLSVLMDIRDELQKLNSLLHCQNFTGIPEVLRQIRLNTHKPKRKRKAK